MSELVSPSNPYTTLNGMRRFGLAPDGSDIRDLGARLDRWQTEKNSLRDEIQRLREQLVKAHDILRKASLQRDC